MEVREIALNRLIPSRDLRTEGTDVSELAASIREHGLLQPIRVRPLNEGMYQIIAGQRRFRAHQALGRSSIPAVVVEETDQEAAVQSIVENLQREDLTPLELAHGVRELASAFRLNPDQIALSISKSPSQVRTWIRLSRLPDVVLEKLQSGEGGTHNVSGLSPRHLQPFVSSMPTEEEVSRDPEAAVKFEETISTARRFQEEVERRGARVNAHMADEIARRTRAGQTTIGEALDDVLAHPERYRYGYSAPEEMQADTYQAYVTTLRNMSASVYKLRPEISVSFTEAQRRDLAERLTSVVDALLRYREALTGTRPAGQAQPQQLAAGRPVEA